MKMLDALTRIMEDHQMVSIYGNESCYDYFFTGYIQGVNESGLLLSKQNEAGYNNGFVLFTDIVYFETNTPDTVRHEQLFQLRGITPRSLTVNSGEDLLEQVLEICHTEKLCCNVFKKEDDEGDEVGFISEIHNTYIVVDCISRYGEYYGKSYVDKSDIYRLFIDGEYEQTFQLLYNAASPRQDM